MALIDKALARIQNSIMKASRGTLSDFVLNAPHEYGQPPPEIASVDAQGLITPQRMREIVMKVGTPAACMNATLDYASNVKLAIRSVNPAKPVSEDVVEFVERFLRRPNRTDNGLEFKQKLMRDLFTLGKAAVEIERGPGGSVANLNVLDAARLYIDYDEHGTLLGYDMLDITGMPIHRNATSPYAWAPDEVILFRMNPISSSLYPTSRLMQLFTYAVIEDMMHTYIGQRFTDSNVPRGVFDLGDITEMELKQAIANWNSQANSSHKIMLTGSKGSSKWYPFNYNLNELEAPALLNEIKEKIMAIVGVTKNELGDSEDVNKSNGYNLSYTFKKRAIEPLLNCMVEQLTTRLLWDVWGLTDIEFYYEEIDSRDVLVQSQIDETYMKLGVLTLNQIRNRRGDPSIEGGDVPMLWSGNMWIPVQMVEPLMEIQMQALQGVVTDEQAAAQGGNKQDGGSVSPPIIRPPQLNGMSTPGGRGSEMARIRYPRAKPENQAKTDLGQPARGPVQTARNAGVRIEY